jgi:hypothetical protein
LFLLRGLSHTSLEPAIRTRLQVLPVALHAVDFLAFHAPDNRELAVVASLRLIAAAVDVVEATVTGRVLASRAVDGNHLLALKALDFDIQWNQRGNRHYFGGS